MSMTMAHTVTLSDSTDNTIKYRPPARAFHPPTDHIRHPHAPLRISTATLSPRPSREKLDPCLESGTTTPTSARSPHGSWSERGRDPSTHPPPSPMDPAAARRANRSGSTSGPHPSPQKCMACSQRGHHHVHGQPSLYHVRERSRPSIRRIFPSSPTSPEPSNDSSTLGRSSSTSRVNALHPNNKSNVPERPRWVGTWSSTTISRASPTASPVSQKTVQRRQSFHSSSSSTTLSGTRPPRASTSHEFGPPLVLESTRPFPGHVERNPLPPEISAQEAQDDLDRIMAGNQHRKGGATTISKSKGQRILIAMARHVDMLSQDPEVAKRAMSRQHSGSSVNLTGTVCASPVSSRSSPPCLAPALIRQFFQSGGGGAMTPMAGTNDAAGTLNDPQVDIDESVSAPSPAKTRCNVGLCPEVVPTPALAGVSTFDNRSGSSSPAWGAASDILHSAHKEEHRGALSKALLQTGSRFSALYNTIKAGTLRMSHHGRKDSVSVLSFRSKASNTATPEEDRSTDETLRPSGDQTLGGKSVISGIESFPKHPPSPSTIKVKFRQLFALDSTSTGSSESRERSTQENDKENVEAGPLLTSVVRSTGSSNTPVDPLPSSTLSVLDPTLGLSTPVASPAPSPLLSKASLQQALATPHRRNSVHDLFPSLQRHLPRRAASMTFDGDMVPSQEKSKAPSTSSSQAPSRVSTACPSPILKLIRSLSSLSLVDLNSTPPTTTPPSSPLLPKAPALTDEPLPSPVLRPRQRNPLAPKRPFSQPFCGSNLQHELCPESFESPPSCLPTRAMPMLHPPRLVCRTNSSFPPSMTVVDEIWMDQPSLTTSWSAYGSEDSEEELDWTLGEEDENLWGNMFDDDLIK